MGAVVKNRWVTAISGLITLATLVMAFLVGVLGAMPTTVLTQDKTWKVYSTAFIPEAWSFFTKDPDSSSLIALRLNAAHGISQSARLDSLPQSLNTNGWGISRIQRSFDTEKALYAGKISVWTTCGGMTNEECIGVAKGMDSQQVDGAKGSPNLCGTWLLAEAHVVPYAFRNVTPYELKVDNIVKVNITCS